MDKKQIEKLKEIIDEEGTGLDILSFVSDEDLKECEDADDVEEYLDELNENFEITNEEIICYNNAIRFLTYEDPSLQESLKIAEEYNMSLQGLDSEILASLLKTRMNEEKYDVIIDRIKDRLEEIFEDDD